MRLQPATILNAVLLMEYVHAVSTARSYQAASNAHDLPPFTVNNWHDAKRFIRARAGVDDEVRTINLAGRSPELDQALVGGIDPVMDIINNVNILQNLAPVLSNEAKASQIPFPVGNKDKVHKALLLLSGNSNYLDAVTGQAQSLRNYLKLLETESDHSAPAVVDAMEATRSDWDKYKKLLDHLNFKKQKNVLRDWLGEESSTADMFELLTSDVKEEDLYNGKLLAAFDTYVEIYNTKHPTERLSLLAALTVCFGDFRVAQMIDTAKSMSAFKEMGKSVKNLESRQIKYWVDARKTPDEVAQLLRIGSPLLESSEIAMIGKWLKFIQELSKHEKETSLYPIKTLKRLYSHSSLNFDIRVIKFLTSESDLEKGPAELLRACLMRHWFNSLKTPDQLETLFKSKSLKSFDGKDLNFASLLKRYKKLYNKFAPSSQNPFYSGLKTTAGLRDEKWYSIAFAELRSIISQQNENEPIEKLSLFVALTLRYGDREASTIIDSVMKIDETMQIAKVLETEQIQFWIDTGKTSDEVFKLLDFNSRTLGYKWVRFCNMFSLRHPQLGMDPFKQLSKYFSDDVLAMFVVMATSEKLDNAQRYKDTLMRRWFEEMKNPEELETLLNQNENKKRFFVRLLKTYSEFHTNLGFISTSTVIAARDKVNVLTSSDKKMNLHDGRVLAAIKAYVEVYNEVNPYKPLSLLAVLTARLGFKNASTVIGAAKALPDLAKTAKQLETEQIQFWMDVGRSPDQVSKLLNFDSKSPDSVYKWVEFHDRSISRDPKLAFDLFKPLRKHFSDDELALFVVEAQPIDMVNAKRLQSLLVWRWFEEMKTPEEVEAQLNRNEKKHLFVSLLKTYNDFHENLGPLSKPEIIRLGHSTGDITPDMLHVLTSTDVKMNLHDGSVLAAIDAYIRLYNEASTREPLSLLAALTARLGHRDASTVIEAAEVIPNLAKTAKQLETEQMQFWVDAGMTPNQVIELLDPKSQGLDIIYRYIKFLEVLSARSPESLLDPVGPLRAYFSDLMLATFAVEGIEKKSDDAERLQAMLLRSWFNNMMPSEAVAKLLHSDEDNPTNFENLLKTYENYQRWHGQPSNQDVITREFTKNDITSGRAFRAFEAHINKYNEMNPMDQMSMIAVLTARFGDEKAAHVIEAATLHHTSKDLAEKVRSMQMKQWLSDKKAPLDVLKWTVSEDKAHVFQHKVFAWLKYVNNYEKANPNEALSLYSILVAHFSEELEDKAIFAKKVPKKWEKVAERLRNEMEQWWRDTMKSPNDILNEMKFSLRDANVVTDRKFKAYIKYSFEYSEYSNLNFNRMRQPVLARIMQHHTIDKVTDVLIQAKSEEKAKVTWKIKSGTAIDPLEIFTLGSTQGDIGLINAWISYISTIIGPTCLIHDGCDVITLMTSTFTLEEGFEKLKWAMEEEEALEDNAAVLIYEIFDEWAHNEDYLEHAKTFFETIEKKDPTKLLSDMLADYRRKKKALHVELD